ncbi:MAG: methyl-accepting chemotaxis protein [Anaerolineae bacterium]|nr:methyl-accepting chemotaxis protein [Anaerolineae bacterium]
MITSPNLNTRIRALFANPTPFISAGILAVYTALICLIVLGIGMTGISLLIMSLIALPIGFVIGLWMNRMAYQRTEHILSSYITTMEQVAEGDLTLEFHPPTLAPNLPETLLLARLVDTSNEMLKRIRRVLVGVNNALTRLDKDTQAILEATSKQIFMTNEQDSVVTETTATVNEVRATVTETAERAQSVAETAQISVDISKSGIDAVNQTIAGMQLIRKRVEDIADNILVLSEHTQQIGEIIATVNSLADQSRMLALNASVEAARAGEEGKGFAVVAMEVRNLADQNRDATVQVREILGEIQRATNAAVMVTEEGSKGVDTGQKLVNSAGDAIRNLARAIEEAAMAALQIAASTRQQTIGMDQLTHAMRTIKHATGETVSGTMQVEASVQRLRDAAYLVNNLLGDLKLG